MDFGTADKIISFDLKTCYMYVPNRNIATYCITVMLKKFGAPPVLALILSIIPNINVVESHLYVGKKEFN